MSISDHLVQALDAEVDAAYADGYAAAVQVLVGTRNAMQSAEVVGDEAGFEPSYLDGMDDAISTLQEQQPEEGE
jgi:hypothetical protein